VASTTGSASIKATLTASGSGLEGATIQCKNGSTTLTSGTTDSNGECTLDLSTLQAGNYTLTIEYDGDTTHQATSTTHTINITDPTPGTWTYADISTSSTEWSTTPQSDGVHATNNYVAYQTKIPSGNTLEITLNISGGVILDLKDRTSSNSASLSFKNNEITKWGSVGSGKVSNDGIPTGNGVTVQITNTGTGTFAYSYSDGTSGTVTLSNGNLDSYYLTFNNNNSGEVVITSMRYKTNT
jgi:hypothetical protein